MVLMAAITLDLSCIDLLLHDKTHSYNMGVFISELAKIPLVEVKFGTYSFMAVEVVTDGLYLRRVRSSN